MIPFTALHLHTILLSLICNLKCSASTCIAFLNERSPVLLSCGTKEKETTTDTHPFSHIVNPFVVASAFKEYRVDGDGWQLLVFLI